MALPSLSNFSRADGPFQLGLHQKGRRLTPQRQKVLSLFQSLGAGIHLSAEDVHHKLIEESNRVSLATIYRTLNLLVQMGLIHELELSEGGHRFELASHDHPDHHHLVCVRCGRTEEFENEQVLSAGKQAAQINGFKLLESTLTVRAVCPECNV